jgi:diguanylate cyclase (GGDEF)-like protein
MLCPDYDPILNNPSLPSLPIVALEVLGLASREDVDIRDFEKTIERDQAMSIRILRAVNSSYYGLGRRCGSIRQAVSYLGIQTVKSLVLGFSLERAMEFGDDEITFDFTTYWRRCFITSSASRAFAKVSGDVDSEEAFIAGLIHDIGMVGAWRVHGDRYLQMIDMAHGDQSELIRIERRILDLDHSKLGSAMAEFWRLPSKIVNSISHHHDDISQDSSIDDMSKVVRLAVMVVDFLEKKEGRTTSDLVDIEVTALNWFGIDREKFVVLVESIVEDAGDLAKALKIDAGRMPPVEAILQRAQRLSEEIPRNDDFCIETPSQNSIDSVTGLPGRDALVSDLESCFRSTNCSKGDLGSSNIALLLIGIEDIRRINENVGDLGGDAVLAHVADVVREVTDSVSGMVGVYRFVGAEIVLILRGFDEKDTMTLGESIRRFIAHKPVRIDGRDGDSDFLTTRTTIGIGFHRFGDTHLQTESPDALLRAAMCAVAVGRRAGGDRIILHHEEEEQTIRRA